MILCLDIGNSQIHGGVFTADFQKVFQFRKSTSKNASSDETGVFLRSVLRENDIDPKTIDDITLCTVVPEALYSIINACIKYLHRRPFVLKAGVKTGLKIKYRNPLEVGADRISNAVAARHLWPSENLIVVDFGTATTFCALHRDSSYMGGVIIPGLKISMASLEANTAKLPTVAIVKPKKTLGQSTVDSIQSGLFWSHVGAVRQIIENLQRECFSESPVKVIATGGFTHLFTGLNLYDEHEPDLVLKGLLLTLLKNKDLPNNQRKIKTQITPTPGVEI